MGAKDNAAVIQLFDLLESRYALRVIWALSDGHPQTFRLLQDSVGGVTPNTLNTRLKELRAARLVDHTGDGYRLTSAGADEVASIARALFVAIVNARRDPPDAAQRHEAEQAALIDPDRIS